MAGKTFLGTDGQPMQAPLEAKCCGTCLWGRLTKEIMSHGLAAKARECRGVPPAVTHFLLPPPAGQSQPNVITHSGWGNVPIDGVCRLWELKPEQLN